MNSLCLALALAGQLAVAQAAPEAPPTSLPAPEHATSTERPIYQLRYTTADAVVTGVTGVAWILSDTVLKSALAPPQCRWCDRDSSGNDTLNALDSWARGARWSLDSQKTASSISDAVGLATLPVTLAAIDFAMAWKSGHPKAFVTDALILVEVVALSSFTTQVVKFSVGRERPFVHALPESERPFTNHPSDNNLSFFSGHTSSTFSLAVAAGTIATLRGYRYAPVLWAVGLPIAATTAYLRIAADRHYLTDVLVGAAAGAAFGYLVPTLLHPRTGTLHGDTWFVRLAPMPNGAAVVGAF